jgi:hypothetical protein
MDEVIDALCRTLEAHGLSPESARLLAAEQAHDLGASRAPSHHVVPVATGWLVVSGRGLTDSELFSERDQAEARARELAAPEHGSVCVHDAHGHAQVSGESGAS